MTIWHGSRTCDDLTLLAALAVSDKPWLAQKDGEKRRAWWTTFLTLWLGVIAAAVVCFFGWRYVYPLYSDAL